MSMQFGIIEIIMMVAGGLLCLGLPIGIVAMLVIGQRKQEK